jgi:hypothetical protein
MSTHQMILMLLRVVRCGRLRLAAAGTATEHGFTTIHFSHCAVLSEVEQLGYATQ